MALVPGYDREPIPWEPPPEPVLPPGFLFASDKRYGSPLPLVFGRAVVPGQVVYKGNRTQGTGPGVGTTVGGGVGVVSATLFGLDVVIALCEAPVDSVVRVYRKTGGEIIRAALAQFADVLVLTGGTVTPITAATATAWSGYTGTAYEGMAHSGTCHVRLTGMALTGEGKIPDTRWEVQSTSCVTAASTPDADPADLLVYLLTDPVNGLGYAAGTVNVETGIDGNAASSYRRYVNSRRFYVSRTIEQGTKIAEVIDQLLMVTNSTLTWVDGVLTAVPLDDEASSTGNAWPGHGSYPYTPVTATTAIGDDDYAEQDGDPVEVKRKPRGDIFSTYPVRYTLRRTDSGEVTYDTAHAEYQSDVFTSDFGGRRAREVDLTPWVLSERVALWASYLSIQRALYHRTRYQARLKPKHALLAPADLVSFTDSVLGLSAVKARLERVREDEDGALEVTALEWPVGATAAFDKAITIPGGRLSQGVASDLAAFNLTNTPPGVVDVAKLTSSQVDKDNLWPNPTSEIAPPTGADTSQPEWAKRYNAGGGAYSGSYVRRLSAEASGFWIPCSPGAAFYAEAQAKRESGSGAGLRLKIGFYPTLGSFSGGTVTNGTSSTSGSWAKIAVSAVAGAGMCAAFIACEAQGSDVGQFDALYARRVTSRTFQEAVGEAATSDVAQGTTTGTSAYAVPNATVTITTTGRPVVLGLEPPTGASNWGEITIIVPAGGDTGDANHQLGILYWFYRDSSTRTGNAKAAISTYDNGAMLPGGIYSFPLHYLAIDTPAAGTHTYALNISSLKSGCTVGIGPLRVIAYEL